ncbi:MAG: methyl-accepting chemotaxis protein [Gammaproteobacteria bacterium]|nr:methyl-accepting chemotaxis protein [Gammaproteobacteria bacterium]
MSEKKKMSLGVKGVAGDRTTVTAVVLMLLSMLLGISIYIYDTQNVGYDREFQGIFADMRIYTQQVTKFSGIANEGRPQTFDELRKHKERLDLLQSYLIEGNLESGMPALPADTNAAYEQMLKVWKEYEKNVFTIESKRGIVVALSEIVKLINQNSEQMLVGADEVATLMASNKNFKLEQVYIAARQMMLTQRLITNVNEVFRGGETAAIAAEQFNRDAELFARVNTGFLDGDKELNIKAVKDEELLGLVEDLGDIFESFNQQAGGINERGPDIILVSEAIDKIIALNDPLLNSIDTLESSYENYVNGRLIDATLGSAFGVITVLLLLLLGVHLKQSGDRRLQETEMERKKTETINRSNQEAIMRLLDEMGDLADGDLTVNATVSEDITGAIADSMNFTVDALRTLVSQITGSATEVLSSVEKTRTTVTNLSHSSRQQAEQIVSASAAANDIAESTKGVANNATQLASESAHSVDIAKKGAQTVQKSISGMNTIRDQIQETSKRIKRLGESSQEIGDIVELINDIAEQTNILSLNAAIQAAMAGEAGRGFAVVADEVQRLAERSADATKQIEALVKTIQTDTSEAITSMERSTSEVVSGAKLAEDAGTALSEIEQVSAKLAVLIEGISDATKNQTSASSNITKTMDQILEITTKTTEETDETASSITNLADLANGMKHSVSGFKL